MIEIAQFRRRARLCLGTLAAKAIDVTVTLAGQSSAYWQGDHTQVFEANPLSLWLLQCGPRVYIAATIGWALLTVAMLVLLPRGLAKVLAFAVIFGHAIGVASWAIHGLGLLGFLACVPILIGANRLLTWAWKEEA